MFRWACSAYLWALPVLLWAAYWVRCHRSSVTAPWATVASLPGSVWPTYQGHGRVILLRALGLGCLLLALAKPQSCTRVPPAPVQGIDIMLAIDVSSSMLALDFSKNSKPYTRLEALKAVVESFMARRSHDALGVVAFAGTSCVVSPLTTQHAWVTQRLQSLQVGCLPEGTALGEALGTCLNRLQASQNPSEPHGQIVVLMSDGVHNCGRVTPAAAAKALAQRGIRVYAIGVGQGGKVPTLHLDHQGQYVRNAFGKLDVLRAQIPTDPGTLRAVAEATGGQFFQACQPEDLRVIYDTIHGLQTTALSQEVVRVHHDWTALPLAAALLFLAAEYHLKCKYYLPI